jgi:ABC-type ATPase with predicted acetyltransferase domain
MEKLTIEAVDRDTLTESDFLRINQVSQDMWASEEGLGELAQCNDCGKMMSKEHVF